MQGYHSLKIANGLHPNGFERKNLLLVPHPIYQPDLKTRSDFHNDAEYSIKYQARFESL